MPVEKVVTQIVEVEKERVVEKTVEVEVQKVVTQIVEKEKIVEKIVTAEAMPVKVTPVEIVLWSFDPLHVKHFTQVASFWKDKWAQYDLSFDFLTVPFDELVTKLLANMSAGAELPDLTAIEIGQWSKFMKGDIAESQLGRSDAPDRRRSCQVHRRTLDPVYQRRKDIWRRERTVAFLLLPPARSV